jgi:predicted phosphodiesterase
VAQGCGHQHHVVDQELEQAMRFTLISDVHADIHQWHWSDLQHCDPTIPMVVAGDISNDVFETSHWIKHLRSMFPKVIWVAGNHCFYNLGFHKSSLYNREFDAAWPRPRTVDEIYDHYTRWSKAHDVHFLHRHSVIMDGVQFVGATGWHNFDAAPYLNFDDQVSAWQNSMMDSTHINWGANKFGDFRPVLTAALDDADYLRETVRENSLPKVVITHHIPHRNLVKVTFNHTWNLLNGSFLNTELETCADPSVSTWCYGHTHFRDDRMIDGVRYVNNARGYPNENPSWSPVEIDV